jgi:hypothetical protein
MDAWVDEREWVAYQWPYLLTLLGGAEEVDRVAREVRSFRRPREVRSASELLQLLMLWSVVGCSLRETAVIAEEAGLATISNVGLLKRFRQCQPLINALLGRLLIGQYGSIPSAYRMRLIDATTARAPGSKGTNYRIHLGIDLSTSAVDHVEITDYKSGETFERFAFSPNEIVIGDRGYAHRGGLKKIADGGAYFIVRLPYQAISFESEDRTAFDVLGTLRRAPEALAVDHEVWVAAPDAPRLRCRLIAIRKTEVATESARRKMIAEARKKGRQPSVGALEMAGFVCLLTNLPPSFVSAQVLSLYRLRWQIEMKFKTIKGVVDVGAVPVKTPELALTYLGAKLMACVMIDSLANQYESFSPWGYPMVVSTATSAHQ